MQKAKDEISQLLWRLPDDCTLEDIQYHLFVLQKRELRREFIVWINRILHKKRIMVDLSSANEEEMTHMIMENIENLKTEGKIESREEIARKMKSKGFDIDYYSFSNCLDPYPGCPQSAMSISSPAAPVISLKEQD